MLMTIAIAVYALLALVHLGLLLSLIGREDLRDGGLRGILMVLVVSALWPATLLVALLVVRAADRKGTW